MTRLLKAPQRSARALALLFGLGLTVAGCGSGGSGGGTSTAVLTSNAAVHLTTSYGVAKGPVSKISWGLPYGEPPTLDPPNTAYYSSMLVDSEMCDSLARKEVDGTVRPGLASSITQPNTRTIRIVLRPGIKFWDGSLVTAQDVAYSLQQSTNPATAIGALFYAVKSIVPVSRYVTVIHLSQPDELIRQEMVSLFGMVWEKRFAEKAGKQFGTAQAGIMCSGPYEFKRWTPGQQISLQANPSYWDRAWVPRAKTLILKFFSDSTTLAQALQAGEIDGAYDVPAQVIPSLKNASSGSLHYGNSEEYVAVSPARHGGPLADVKLREALSMTIDRSAIAKAVFYGAAQPYYTEFNPTSWPSAARSIYSAAYKPYEQRGETFGSAGAIATAKAMVKASDYRGQPLKLITEAGDVTLNQIAQLIQAQASQIGLKVTIDQLPSVQYTQATYDAKARGNADLLLASGFNVATDPLEDMPFGLLPGAAYNYDGYNNATVTNLLKLAAEQPTAAGEARDFVKAQSIYQNAYTDIPIVEVDEISFLNNRLSGLPTNFSYMWDPTLALVGAAN